MVWLVYAQVLLTTSIASSIVNALSCYQDTDQLRNNHGRMGIVDLDDRIIVHLSYRFVLLFLHLHQDQLCSVADHEILLINTKQAAGFIGIIRDIRTGSGSFRCLPYQNAIPSFTMLSSTALDVEQAQLIDAIVVAGYVNIIQTGGNLSVTEQRHYRKHRFYVSQESLLDPVVLCLQSVRRSLNTCLNRPK